MKRYHKNILFSGCMLLALQAAAQQNYSFENLPQVKETKFKNDTLSILKYGAKDDGITLNTRSINEAITACSKKGGGVVLIPAGFWLSGPLQLKSNVNLHLAKNALLQFTKDFKQYKLVEGNWEGLPQMRNESPISATGAENIAITGEGIIDGNGDAWRMVKRDKLTESQWNRLVASGGISPEKSSEFYESVKDYLRPNLVVFTNCKRVLLEGVTFQNSAAWNLHPIICEDLIVRNVYAKNPWYAQNGDGIDLESCKNVLIEGSTFDVGDDGICIKSGRDAEGRKRGIPTENVIVRNSTVYHAHGGFVIGSEMSGGARNIFVYDCTFIGTDIGLRFKTTRGRGGLVEKIFAKNIVMKDIVGEAILFDMYYMAKDPIPLAGENREAIKEKLLPVTEETPVFRDFHISNVVCDGASKALFIRGLPEMSISDIYLDHLVIQSDKGIDIQEAKNIQLSNVKVISNEKLPLINIHNGTTVSFNKIDYNKSELFFNISGARNSGIKLINTDLKKAVKTSVFTAGADAGMLTIK
jgi:polygalacturonase